jgi:hypothetical protein
MTTASDGVAVIAADVARTDRRALSEAWYSALHLARAAVPPRGSAPARTVAASAPPTTAPRHARGTPGGAPQTPVPRRGPGAPVAAATPPASGHAERDAARRIASALAAFAGGPRIARAQTIEVAGGRVRLLVRSDGRTTRVVAVCSAALREPVERALAGARYALAAGFRA